MNSIDIIFERNYSFPGESFKGEIILNYPKEKLESIGYMIIPSEFWEVKFDKGFHTSPPTFYKFNIECLQPKGPDQSSIIFDIPINKNFLPCFEYNSKGKHAHNRYELKILAKTINNYDIKLSKYILVLSRPELNFKIKIEKEAKQSVKNFYLFDKGEVKMKLILPDINFKYNAPTELTVEIDNTKGQLATDEYKVVITRKLELSEIVFYKHYEEEKEIMAFKEKAKVKVGEKKSFNCNFKLWIKIMISY